MKLNYKQIADLNRSLDVIGAVMFDTKTNISIAKIRQHLIAHLNAYQEVFNKIENKYFDFSIKLENGGHPIKDPTKATEVGKEKDELNNTVVDVDIKPLKIKIPKGDKTITGNVLIGFIEAFGEDSVK